MKFVTVASHNHRKHAIALQRAGRGGRYVVIAECSSEQTAQMIADALNTEGAREVLDISKLPVAKAA